jgi:uncharacterized protein DUF6194
MDEASITQYITDTFEGIETLTVESTGNTFFFYDPDRMFPFATLVTTDYNDSFSNLNRPSVFRLNVGVSKQTFLSLFGSRPSPSSEGNAEGDGYDFTALDQLMPHPVYGRMYWVCVLNPSDATFETIVRPLLAEAYDMAVNKYSRRAARRSG